MPLPFPPCRGETSPWGMIQTVTPLGPDAVLVETASHGGLRVSPAALARIPAPLRATPYSGGGWFAEDRDWCIPYLVLSLDRFESDAARAAAVSSAARAALRCFDPAQVAAIEALDAGARS